MIRIPLLLLLLVSFQAVASERSGSSGEVATAESVAPARVHLAISPLSLGSGFGSASIEAEYAFWMFLAVHLGAGACLLTLPFGTNAYDFKAGLRVYVKGTPHLGAFLQGHFAHAIHSRVSYLSSAGFSRGVGVLAGYAFRPAEHFFFSVAGGFDVARLWPRYGIGLHTEFLLEQGAGSDLVLRPQFQLALGVTL